MPAGGQLNAKINLLSPVNTTDAAGEVTTTYEKTHQRIPAMREEVSGGSTRRGLQVEESVRTVLTIPYVSGVTPEWQVELLGPSGVERTLEIVSAIDRSDPKWWLELQCSDVR
jgi:head-tail adaptor